MAETLVKQNASINDTVELISGRIAIDSKSEFIQALVNKLSQSVPPGCESCFLAHLQDYVHRNVRYVLDPLGRERVFKPETTVKNGEGDCKKMTVIIASALKAAGIPGFLKHVFWHGKDYTHIYVVVPAHNSPTGKNYYTLDPVENSIFDKECSYDYSHVYDFNGKKMDLYTGAVPPKSKLVAPIYSGCAAVHDDIAGIAGAGSPADIALIELMMPDSEPETMSGIGRKSKEERKENRKKLKDKLKGVGLAPVRAAFLGLVALNVIKIAERLLAAYGKDQNRVKKFWQNAGGNWDNLKGAIAHGTGQRISGTVGYSGCPPGYYQNYFGQCIKTPRTHQTAAGIGAVGLAAAGAAMATALPLVEQAIRMFKDLGISKGAEDDRMMDESLEEAETEAAAPGFNPVASVNSFINANAQALPGGVITRPGGGGSPTLGGDTFNIDWTDPLQIFYAIFRGGFYAGLLWKLIQPFV